MIRVEVRVEVRQEMEPAASRNQQKQLRYG